MDMRWFVCEVDQCAGCPECEPETGCLCDFVSGGVEDCEVCEPLDVSAFAKRVLEHKSGPSIPMMGYDPSPVESLMASKAPDDFAHRFAAKVARLAKQHERDQADDDSDWRRL